MNRRQVERQYNATGAKGDNIERTRPVDVSWGTAGLVAGTLADEDARDALDRGLKVVAVEDEVS